MDEERKPTIEAKLEKVRHWLLRAGYPLEMRVARAFTMASMFNRIVLGDIYTSKDKPDTQRAIDVVAQRGAVLHRPAEDERESVSMFFDLFTVVECKSNAKGNRPWLVFTDPTSIIEPEFRVSSHHGSELGEWLLRELCVNDRVGALPLFSAPRVGYSVVCAVLGDSNPRENNQDTAYEAVMEVLSAARAKANVHSSSYRIFRIVIPVIVVAADLYETWLDHHGELQLEARDEMALLYKTRPGLDRAHSMIYIVTEAKLGEFIERIELAHETLSEDEELLKRGCKEIPPDPEPPDGFDDT